MKEVSEEMIAFSEQLERDDMVTISVPIHKTLLEMPEREAVANMAATMIKQAVLDYQKK